jgi:hypothetical protein
VGRDTVSSGGAADRRVRPVSGRGTRTRGACGPAREGAGVGRAQLNSKVLHLFELV